MKGYYIFSKEKNISLGVLKKVMTQSQYFETQLGECVLCPAKGKDGAIYKILKRIPFFPSDIDWNCDGEIINADYIYIRKPVITIDFMRLLKRIRRKNPNAIIVMEIPTYPYEGELKSIGLNYFPLVFRDNVNRRFLYKYINYFAVIGKVENFLWRVPTIKFFNGIDLDKVKKRTPDSHFNSIRLVCVANFARYHGIDRLLRGMEAYYRTLQKKSTEIARNIEVHLVGEGEQIGVLHEMVDNSILLQKHVFFYGSKTPEDISDIYNMCDIGIVSLGYDRIGLSYNTTIKSKEYLAAGLPFVTDTDIDVFEGKYYKYCRKLNICSDMINIYEIIDFFDELGINDSIEVRKNIANEMREYAEKNVGYNSALKKITDRMVNNDD